MDALINYVLGKFDMAKRDNMNDYCVQCSDVFNIQRYSMFEVVQSTEYSVYVECRLGRSLLQ